MNPHNMSAKELKRMTAFADRLKKLTDEFCEAQLSLDPNVDIGLFVRSISYTADELDEARRCQLQKK